MITESELKKLGFEFVEDDSNNKSWRLWDEEVELLGETMKYKIINFDVDKQVAKACFGYSGQAKIMCKNLDDLKQFLDCISFLRSRQVTSN